MYNALRKQNTKEGNVVDTKVQVFVLPLFASFRENDTWHMDSNASMHLFFHREWFRNYERIPPIKIYMSDDLGQEGRGKGNTNVSMTVGENTLPKVFTNVLHVPGIAKNLFSMSKVISPSYIFEFRNNKCIVKNMLKEVVGHGTHDNQLYKLHCSTKLRREKCAQVVNLGKSALKSLLVV
jgi:hypothetical protein